MISLKTIMKTGNWNGTQVELGKVYSNPYANSFKSIKEGDGEDHEVSMAQNSLDIIIKMATELKAKMGENEKDIPAWIQDHITNAENFISQASSNYHEYGKNESVNEAKKYDIGAGYMGNGLTIWNRAEQQHGDYRTIAHIDNYGKISIRDKQIPSNVMKMIEDWAIAMKKGDK
jgi:hypothetical protein